MAELKYIMQGFKEEINFLDEIKNILENKKYTDIWVLTAFVNDLAIYNLMPSIKKSKANISFIVGIRNNVSTYQALEHLYDFNVNLFTFDTARADSIFHAKVIVGYGIDSAKVICGSANITTGGLVNNIEAGIVMELDLKVHTDKSFLVEAKEYIEKIIRDYPENVKLISEKKEIFELFEYGLLMDEKQGNRRRNFSRAVSGNGEKMIVSRFPLERKKLRGLGKKQKQMNAILRKVDQITVEELGEEVWKSKKLAKTHLGIVRTGTRPKCEMSLGKGQYRDIDQLTYFRNDVFGDLEWEINKKGDEIADAHFTVILCGINYGEYTLTLLHKRKEMVAYQQDNYVTSIRWGEVSHLVKNKNLLGRELILYKIKNEKHFIIDIE